MVERQTYGLYLRAEQQKRMPQWNIWGKTANFKSSKSARLYKNAPEQPRLVLPPQALKAVMKQAHRPKDHEEIQEAFGWPTMPGEKKQKLINECPTCVVHSKRSPNAPIGDMPLPK